MDSRETKRTVPVPSVGADGEQPISQTPTASITEETTENNPPEKNYAELLRKMQRMNDPAYLPTISMNELYENVYQSRPPVIDGLLYPGTYLFAGAPETNCQGLFNQIHKKGARSTVWLLTPRLTAYIFPSSRSLQRYA